MSKLQLVIVSLAVVLLGVLYFGFDTTTKKQSEVKQSTAKTIESTGIQTLLNAAKSTLTAEQLINIQALEQAVNKNSNEQSTKVESLKKLSGSWFDYKHPAIAGHYAEEIAEILGDESSWSIAGTTYALGIKQSGEDKIRSYCMGRAVKAFENAISLNPSNIDHQLNLAICYTDIPPKDNPMKGILMLVNLNKEYPDHVGVLTNLGRLGIQTGQFEKAIGRLEKAYALESENPQIVCLLADAYKGAGKTEEAMSFASKCQSFSNN